MVVIHVGGVPVKSVVLAGAGQWAGSLPGPLSPISSNLLARAHEAGGRLPAPFKVNVRGQS